MKLLLDTHVWAWMLAADAKLSERAIRELERADSLYLSPISFFEIGQKARLGKWPSMEKRLDQLENLAEDQGILTAMLTPSIAMLASRMDWSHRDPFDRILAATSIASGVALLSADTMFDSLIDDRLQRIW